MKGIEVSLAGARKFMQTIAERLFLPDEARVQVQGKALQDYGKGLQEIVTARSMDMKESLATVSMLHDMGISESMIRWLIESQPERLTRMVPDAQTLRRRVRDGTILAAEVVDEKAQKAEAYRPPSGR